MIIVFYFINAVINKESSDCMRNGYSKILEASNQLHVVVLDVDALRVSIVAAIFLKSRVVHCIRP